MLQQSLRLLSVWPLFVSNYRNLDLGLRRCLTIPDTLKVLQRSEAGMHERDFRLGPFLEEGEKAAKHLAPPSFLSPPRRRALPAGQLVRQIIRVVDLSQRLHDAGRV